MSAVIWSKTTCSYCDLAKDLFNEQGIAFEERIIGQDWTKDQLLEVVPDAKTVPQIFIEGTHVGGYDDLKSYLGS